jgi:hypothetical protein
MIARTIPRLALALALPALLAAAPASAEPTVVTASAGHLGGADERTTGVAGKVSGPAVPLASARVYLYRLSDLSLVQAVTDERGHFLFDALPAGLYKVIAHKAGFVPAVVQLTRTTAKAYQFLELELSEASEARRDGEDFWSVRSQVPTDVLREIQLAEIQEATRRAGSGVAVAPAALARAAGMAAEMRATTGVDEIGTTSGQVTRGELGVRGRVGAVQLGVSGDYMQLQPGFGAGEEGPTGFARALSLSVASDDHTTVRLSSRNDRLEMSPRTRDDVDFEHYRLAVSHDLGEHGRSDFVAQYTAESNFHRHGGMDPRAIPEESRSWRVEGTYTAELTERTSLQTGLRYRERSSAFGIDGDPGQLPEQQRVDLFGRAGMQVQPSMLVEYGLYTTLRDGSLSLSPRGGLVLQLAPSWQASAAASVKAYEDETLGGDFFVPTLRGAEDLDDACEQNDGHCYQLVVTHQSSDDDSLSLGATHRRFDETQRLYFSDQILDRYDSLYLVPGDEMPEMQLAVNRRLSPTVVTRLQSNLAEGGGGLFYASDAGAYENQVRYRVTSLDTHFDVTSTGLFIAFHQLEQAPQALTANGNPAPRLEVERLELMLTQDLNVLLDMAADMAVQLNMQLSRGSWPFLDEAAQEDREELRKRLIGGIALRF